MVLFDPVMSFKARHTFVLYIYIFSLLFIELISVVVIQWMKLRPSRIKRCVMAWQWKWAWISIELYGRVAHRQPAGMLITLNVATTSKQQLSLREQNLKRYIVTSLWQFVKKMALTRQRTGLPAIQYASMRLDPYLEIKPQEPNVIIPTKYKLHNHRTSAEKVSEISTK